MGKGHMDPAICVAAFGGIGEASTEMLMIATVNNSDMIINQVRIENHG
jgi:hypothetical protein